MPAILPSITFETGPTPAHSILWLHGLGADGSDFVPLAEALHLPVPVRFIFPHAPMRPVSINGGYVMRAWYDIVSDDIADRADSAGIFASQTAIEALIAQERARGIAPGNLILAGFSQGGAMTLHTALRQTEALGGALILSAYQPLPTDANCTAAARQTPLFLAHGQADPIVPPALSRAAYESLHAAGYHAEWHSYPMAHTLCDAEIADIQHWLHQRLQPAGAPA